MEELKDITFQSSMNNLHNLADKAIALGESLGLSQLEVTLSNGFTRSIELKGNSISGVQQQAKTNFLVRGYINTKLGMASTTSLTESSIEEAVNDAYKLAKLSPEDDNFQSLPEPNIREPVPVDKIFDESLANYDPADIVTSINESIDGAKSVHEQSNVSGKLNLNTTEKVIANSLNLSIPVQKTSLSTYSYVSIPLEPTNVGVGSESFYTRTMEEEPDFFELGQKAAKNAESMLDAKSLDSSKKLPILMDQRAAGMSLGSMIAYGTSAFFVMTGTSYFADKIGEEISVDELKVWDDPHVANGRGSAIYDAEGVPTSQVDLFDGGVLQSYVTDSYTSNKLGLENTGHGRKFGKVHRPFCWQVQIDAGSDSFDAMLEDMREGILMKNSGIFSRGGSPEISAKINQGYYVKDGEIQHPLKNTMLGTNVFDFFKNIKGISKELVDEFGSQKPAILVNDIDITGANKDKQDGPKRKMSF